MEGQDRVPRLARAFIATLLVAMAASAIFLFEPWPLTSFRLFSHLRFDEQYAWQVRTLDADGVEAPLSVDSLEHGFKNFGFRMAEFTEASEARRDELCLAWIEGAREFGGRDVAEVRLYLREWRLSERSGDRAAPGTTELRYRCTDEGAEGAG